MGEYRPVRLELANHRLQRTPAGALVWWACLRSSSSYATGLHFDRRAAEPQRWAPLKHAVHGGAAVEPHRLRHWKPGTAEAAGQLYTCARPGRSKGADQPVADDLVHHWVRGLPGETNTVVISLLGRKHGPSGPSEYSSYSFCSDLDRRSERRGRLSFQQWLNRWYSERLIKVIEHPTYDFCPVPAETLAAIASDIADLLSEGRIVVLMDSGGETRTKAVCKYMGFTEDSRYTRWERCLTGR